MARPGDPQQQSIATQSDLAVAAGGLLGKLDTIESLLRDLLLNAEQEPDFDVTYTVYFNNTPSGVQNIELPRTIRHAEIEFTVGQNAAVIVALSQGNQTVSDAAKSFAASGQPNVIAALTTGSLSSRVYLDGSGYLTVWASGNAFIVANIRVRSLDATQQRPQRT